MLPQPAPDTKSPVEANPSQPQQTSQNKAILSKLNLTVPFIKKKKVCNEYSKHGDLFLVFVRFTKIKPILK